MAAAFSTGRLESPALAAYVGAATGIRWTTAEKFINHLWFGRPYRTGDKCKIDIETQRAFPGRIDIQLKVRGHRVEVQAAYILQTQFSEIEAAVLDYQNETLVAFVTAPSISGEQMPEAAWRRQNGRLGDCQIGRATSPPSVHQACSRSEISHEAGLR